MDLTIQQIIEEGDRLEYGFLPNYHKYQDWKTKEETVLFTSYKGRMEHLLRERERDGETYTPMIVNEGMYHKKQCVGMVEYPIVITSEDDYDLVPEGYRVEIYKIDLGKGYWGYNLFRVYKNDEFLFNLIRNYSSAEFRIIDTPFGAFMGLSEDYQAFTIVDIKNRKIYGHETGICPWVTPDLYFDGEKNTLEFSVEGVYWGCESCPQLIDLKLDLTKPIEEETWLNMMKIIDLSDDSDYEEDPEDEESANEA